ncbi:hypothetical protein DP939_10505 [Spongiactinospora rosea]|uniref:Uncharacterized protein n=1 Tax=Spongiactinospora rosea TaxID=2248750 RepID=A0A366M219_9ACTN|nr:hypothetical protein [Spongiactinospora rosea]RBQ20235.1 hypothetical protein DP939_10505 [Spongiactinospora rosea]
MSCQALTREAGGREVLAGAGAGLLATRVALPRVPEFATAPSTPPLLYEPSLGLVAMVAGAALVAAFAAVALTAEALLRGIRADRLRQAQP